MSEMKERIRKKFVNCGKKHRKLSALIIAALALVLTIYYIIMGMCDRLVQSKFRRRLVCVLMAVLLFLQMGPLDMISWLGVNLYSSKEEAYAASDSVDLKRLSGSGKAFMYHNFNEVKDFVPGTTYAFLDGVYGPADAVTMLGSGAVLKAKAENNNSLRYIRGWYGNSATVKVYVDVVKRGKGFDSCPQGGLYSVPNSGTPTEYRYFCYASGAQNAGPLYAYSYDTAALTYLDVSATLNEVGKKGSKNPADYTVKISHDGKTIKLAPSSYTIQVPDPNSDEVKIIVEDGEGNKITTLFRCPMTVMFDGNADGVTNVPAMQTAWRGSSLTLSNTVPVRSGYTFQNWKDSLTGKPYNKGASVTLTQDLKLSAQWKDTQAPVVSYQLVQVVTRTSNEEIKAQVKKAISITDNEPVAECTVSISMPDNVARTMGDKTVTVTVTDKAGNKTTKNYTVNVVALPVEIKSPKFTESTTKLSATLYEPGSDTITETGFVWGIMNNPTISLNNGKVKTSAPVTSPNGSISVTADNLTKGVTYYARAYAIAGGVTYYSSEIPFGLGLPAYGTFTISNNGNNTFTVTRSGGTVGEQKVYFRTVNGSAVGGTHFTHKAEVLTFPDGTDSKTFDISEAGANIAYDGKKATAYSNIDRTYQVELYRITGGGTLGDTVRASRTMTAANKYKVDRTIYTKEKSKDHKVDGEIKNKWVTDHSGGSRGDVIWRSDRKQNTNANKDNFNCSRTLDEAAYSDSLTYIKKTAGSYLYRYALTAHEDEDGREHAWLGTHEPNNARTKNKCNGDYQANSIALDDSVAGKALYTASFLVGEGSDAEKRFPATELRDDNNGEDTGNLGDTVRSYKGDVYTDAATGKRYIKIPITETVYNYFGASGQGEDRWWVKGFIDYTKIYDDVEPQFVAVAPMAGGLYKAGDSFTVSLIFDEIVDNENSPNIGKVSLATSWGPAKYAGGVNTNVLYFTGTVGAGATNTLTVHSISNTENIYDMCNTKGTKTASKESSTTASVDTAVPNLSVTSKGVANGVGTATINVNTDQSKTTALKYVWSDSENMPVKGWVEASASELGAAKGSGLTLGIRKNPGSGSSDGKWYLHVIGTYGTTGATTHQWAMVNFGTVSSPAAGAATPDLTVSADNTNWATDRNINIFAKDGTELKYRKMGDAIWKPLGLNDTEVNVTENGHYTFILTAGDQTVAKNVQVTKLDRVNPGASIGSLATEDSKTVKTAKLGVYTKITLPVIYSDSDSGVTKVEYAWTGSTGTPSSWTTLFNNASSPVATDSRELSYTATETQETAKCLHVRVTDKVGHTYTTKSAAYTVLAETKVNNTPPTVSITGAPTKWTNDMATLIWQLGNYQGKNYVVTLPDGRTSVANKGNLLASQNGTYTVTVEDNNYGASNSASVKVDKLDFTPPTVEVSDVSSGWKNTDQKINFSISDSQSGVGEGYYKYVSAKDEIPTTGLTPFAGTSKSSKSITVSGPKNHYLYYKFYDNAGDDSIGREANKTEGFVGPFLIDTQKVNIGFQVGGMTAVSGKAYPNAPLITVTLKDVSVTNNISGGIKSVTYQVNTAAKKTIDHSYETKTVTDDTFTIPVSEIPDGAVSITVNVTDHAGNTSAGIYSFRVYNNSSITISNVKSPSYDGNAVVPGTDFTVSVNGSRQTPVYQYKKKDAADSSYVGGLPKDAGTYTVKVSAAQDDTNHYRKAEKTFDITIQPKEIGLSWTNTALTYNGTLQKPVAQATTGVVGKEKLAVTVTGEKKNSCQKEGKTSYTATASGLTGISGTNAANYKLPTTKTHTFTIAPKPVTLSWSNKNLIYNGTAQKPTATVNAGDLIKGDTCNVTGIDGAKTDACAKAGVGSYTATATTLDNKNYCLAENSDTISTTYVIDRKEAEILWGSGEFGYDGEAKVPTAEVANLCSRGSTKDVCKVNVSVSAKTGSALSTGGKAVEFGDYIAKASGLSNGNYKLPKAGITKDFHISKAAGAVSVQIDGWTYGYEPASPKQEVKKGDYDTYAERHTDYAPKYEYKEKDASDDAYEEEVPQKAGNYTVRLSYEATHNYAPASAEADFTIAKRTTDIQWGETAFTYNGTVQTPVATVGNIVGTDKVAIQVSGGQTDSCVKAKKENYTATAIRLSGEGAENYKLPTANTHTFTIAQKEVELAFDNLEFTYSGMACLPTAGVTNLCNGDTCSVEVVGEQTDVGTYTAEAVSLSDSNYKLPDAGNEKDFEILPKPLTTEDIKILMDSPDNSYPCNGSEITPAVTVRDEAITTGGEAALLVKDTDYTINGTASARNFGTYSLRVNGTGNYTGDVELTWYITDPNDPTGTITIEDNSWTKFWNTLTFGLFFRETKNVTIMGQDGEGESGLKDIHYYVSDKELTGEEVGGLPESAWTQIESGGTFSVSPDRNVVIYAKITDNAKRTAYINSDGVVLDATAPVITGVADGGKYCAEDITQVTFAVTEINPDKVTVSYSLNGTKKTEELTGKDGTYILPAKGDMILSAVDKAGNESSISLTVSGNHAYGEWVTKKQETCTEEGLREHTCRLCGKVETEDIPAAHVWEENEDGSIKYTMDKKNSCTEEGMESQHCRNCTKTRNERTVPATGHSFGEWKETVSKCTGIVKTHVCEECGTVETQNAGGHHEWKSKATVDKEATCTEDGSKSIHCSRCSATKDTEIIPAVGHKGEEAWIHQARAHWHVCSVCGMVLNQAAHTESDWIIEKEASKTENGRKKKICTACGRELKQGLIPAGGSPASGSLTKKVELKKGAPVKETIVKEDVSELQKAVLEEEECKAILEKGTDIEIIIEVNSVASDKEPDSAKKAEIAKKAVEQIKNAASIKEEELSGKPGLVYVDLSMHKKITTIHRKTDMESGDVTTSTEETVEGVHKVKEAVTITLSIPTDILYSKSEAYVRKFTVVRMHEGDEGTEIEALPTQEKDGTLTFETDRFSVYAIIYQDVSACTGGNHAWERSDTIDKAATCTEAGSKSVHCRHCSEVKDVQTIPATGHKYGLWKVLKKATTKKTGVRKRSCEVCGNVVKEKIPAIGKNKKDKPGTKENGQTSDSKSRQPAIQTATQKSEIVEAPETGDKSRPFLYHLLAVLSGLGAVFFGWKRRKSRKDT